MHKLFLFILLFVSYQAKAQQPLRVWSPAFCDLLQSKLQEGDIIFMTIDNYLFRKVAEATGGWANHVGIAFREKDKSGKTKWIVAESRFPFTVKTDICDYVERSVEDKMAVKRLVTPLQKIDIARMKAEVEGHIGGFYDIWFNYFSSKMFCSKFVYQMFYKTLGVEVGRLHPLYELYDSASPEAREKQLSFWQWWFLGDIPWNQITITPQSQYKAENLDTVLDTTL